LGLLFVIPPLFGALEFEMWQQWKSEFAKRLARRQQNKRPVGVDYVWWDGTLKLFTIPDRGRGQAPNMKDTKNI